MRPRDPGRGALGLELALLAAVLALAGVLFAHALPTPADYDEGVYLAAVDALRHGQELGSQIFTAQPPGFYWLLTGGDVVSGDSLAGVRDFVLALALLGCFGAYLIGRRLAGPAGGLAAASLLAVSPPYPTFAARISADLPCLVLGLLSIAAWLSGGVALSALAGALFAAAVLVKLTGLVLLVPIAGYAVARRVRPRELVAFAAGAAAVALGAVLASLGELAGLWRGVVSYHGAARDVPGPGFRHNVDQLVSVFGWRTPLVWLLALAVLASVLGLVQGRLPLWPLWLFGAASVAVLLWHRPLHDNHLVLLAVALALPSASALGAAYRQAIRWGVWAVLLGVVVIAAGYAREWRRLSRNQGPQPAVVRWAAKELRSRTGPSELVVTDLPLAAYLADRRVPGELVDTAVLRFEAGYLANRDVLDAIRANRVRAVLVTRAFRSRPGLTAALAARFPIRIRRGYATLYLSSSARPSG